MHANHCIGEYKGYRIYGTPHNASCKMLSLYGYSSIPSICRAIDKKLKKMEKTAK